MTKTIKTTSLMLIAILLCALILVFAGCPAKGEQKYDVTIKIVCTEFVKGQPWGWGPVLEEWVFTPDIVEMHTERKYDGKEYVYYVYAYSLPDHPTLKGHWIDPSSDRNPVCRASLAVEGHMAGEPMPKYVCEKGEYCLLVNAGLTSTFNYRAIHL